MERMLERMLLFFGKIFSLVRSGQFLNPFQNLIYQNLKMGGKYVECKPSLFLVSANVDWNERGVLGVF